MSIPTGEVESIEEEARRLRRRTEEYQREQQRGRRRLAAVPPPPTPAPAPTAAPTPDVLTRATIEPPAAPPPLLERQARAYTGQEQPETTLARSLALYRRVMPNVERMQAQAGQVRTALDVQNAQRKAVEAASMGGKGKMPGVPLAQLPRAPAEEAAVARGELGGTPTGPSIVKLGLSVVGTELLTTAVAALVLKFPTLAAFMGEGYLEQKGIIPGKPVTRVTELAAGSMSSNLQEWDVPKNVADFVAQSVVWMSVGKAPEAGMQRDLLAAFQGLSKEDVAKAIGALRKPVLEGERGALGREGALPHWGKLVQQFPETGQADAESLARTLQQRFPDRKFEAKFNPAKGDEGASWSVNDLTAGAKNVELATAEVPALEREGAVPPEMAGRRSVPRELAPTPEDLANANVEREIRDRYQLSLPTIRDIEARSRPIPPEVTAALHPTPIGDVGRINTFGEVAQRWGTRYRENWWTQFSDFLSGKIPAFRTPLARTEADVAVHNAMTTHDLYVITMGEKARARLWVWIDEAKDTLGLQMNTGKLSKVVPKEGVEIPSNLRGVINHVVEFREKYNLTPEQNAILDELTERGVLTEVLRLEQAAGIKIQEIENYFPRYAKKTPPGAPEGGGGPGRLGTRPSHAKHRFFGDVEARYAAGYEDDAIPALFGRVQSGIEATANAETVKVIKAMGLKPSELIDPTLVQAAKDARAEYKAARAAAVRKGATADEKLAVELADVKLDDSVRALRFAAGLARETSPKVFGRVVSQDVQSAFRRYVKDLPESWVDDIFQVARGTMVQGDLSAAGIQTWFTFYRNTPAWGVGLAHGVQGLLTEPTAYLAHNYEPLMRALDVGAIRSPTEFLLSRGGRISRWLAKVPGIKQSQRAFEWETMVAQLERWKAVERLTKTPDDLLEMAAVLRKQSGIFIMPGMTKAQASIVGKLMFAPQFAQAIHSAFFDVFRGGAAGREAMKSVMMAFGGSAALTIAINYKLNGEYPNMIDPDKPGLWGIKVGDGYIYPFGPYQPTIVAITRTSRAINDARQGKVPNPRDLQAVPRLLEAKASIPARMVIAVMDALGIPLTAIRGEPYEYVHLKTPQDWMKWASNYTPIGLHQAVTGLRLNFPPALLEVLGVRTSPMPTWGGIDLRVKELGFTNSKGESIEHYRDLTEPQKLEAEQDSKIKGYMARPERDDDTSKLFAVMEQDRKKGLDWAVYQLQQAGPTNEALKQYAKSIAEIKTGQSSVYRTLDIAGILSGAQRSDNQDVRLRRQLEEYTSPAVGPGGTFDGELYGQLQEEFHQMVGDEVWNAVLVPQLIADRNPQLQQSQIWSLDAGQSGYYDLLKKDGKTADTEARRRLRAADPDLDAKLFLLGRVPKVLSQDAAIRAEQWFAKWMAGEPIPIGTERSKGD